MDALVIKVIRTLNDSPRTGSNRNGSNRNGDIVVFLGSNSLIEEFTTLLTPQLPDNFSSNIDLRHIDTSTVYLKGHKFCTSFYHDSCFRYISPHEFLSTHYNWLWKQIVRLYGEQRSLSWYSPEDLFQDFCMKYLDRILSKVDEASYPHLRTFVANRMRRYVDYLIKEQLEIRKEELKCQIAAMREK
jgi:hypothetical protein